MNTKKVISTILVIIWMLTIFYFSHQQGTGSSNTSKKVANVIVNIIDIKHQMQDEQKEELVEKIEPYIRKLAHYTIYTIGGILLVNCMYVYIKEYKKAVVNASIIGVFYAMTDEIHQLFVSGRSGRIVDVVIDSIGIFTGIVAYLIVTKIVGIIVDKANRKEIGGE